MMAMQVMVTITHSNVKKRKMRKTKEKLKKQEMLYHKSNMGHTNNPSTFDLLRYALFFLFFFGGF